MDIETIAITTVGLLTPYLAEAGRAAAKEMGKGAWEQVNALFRAVRDRFRGNPAAAIALEDLTKAPGDPDSQAALCKELKKILRDDDVFVNHLAEIIGEVQLSVFPSHATTIGSGVTATGKGSVVAGERGVAVGGEIRSSVIITGDTHRQ